MNNLSNSELKCVRYAQASMHTIEPLMLRGWRPVENTNRTHLFLMLMTAERADAMILQHTIEQYLSTDRRHLKGERVKLTLVTCV